MIISLIGYRGTGKSTIGRRLANRLKLPFYDSDEVIVKEAGQSIASIFETEGESGFRDHEAHVVHQLMQVDTGVIAWGGGVILREANRELLKKSNHSIWLTASSKTLLQRIHGDKNTSINRPALTDMSPLEEIEFNLNKREPLYKQCASLELNSEGKSVDELVDQLCEKLANS